MPSHQRALDARSHGTDCETSKLIAVRTVLGTIRRPSALSFVGMTNTFRPPEDRMRAVHKSSLPRWDIYIARYTPAKLLGTVEARDADLAIAEAMKEFAISDPKRLIAVRR